MHSVPSKLPNKTTCHKCLVYEDRLIPIGGCDITELTVFDSIYEIFLIPPYSSKMVQRLPEPVCHHGAERFGNNIYIVGGTPTGYDRDLTDHVLKYDVNTRGVRIRIRSDSDRIRTKLSYVRIGSDRILFFFPRIGSGRILSLFSRIGFCSYFVSLEKAEQSKKRKV